MRQITTTETDRQTGSGQTESSWRADKQGLYIASLGMGIVFLSLVILLVIVLLLRMLPHETDPHTTDNTEDRGTISAIQGDSKSSNKGELQPPIKSVPGCVSTKLAKRLSCFPRPIANRG